MSEPQSYEVYAVRYASMTERARHQNFIVADPHDGDMPMDYFVWALVNDQRTIVVDTGYNAAEAKRRGRPISHEPREGLAMLGIDAARVEDVIITHMHYDHAGTLDDFPRARFHMQELELAYTVSRHMCHQPFNHAYTADHVCSMVQKLFAGRVAFREREDEIAPGVTVHHVGGHTMGLQFVRVLTKRGWVVLASDASHYYENMERTAPFPIVYNLGDMVQGYARMHALAESPKHVVPGHDPLVLSRYPAPKAALEGTVARLDVAPKA